MAVPTIDPEPLVAWGQVAFVCIGIGGLVYALGKIVAKVENLSERFEKHVEDTNIHSDGDSLKQRVQRLEDRTFGGPRL